jgi:hypothetical protein
MEGLKLDGIRAGVGRRVDQFQRQRRVAVMVDPGFGD